MAASRLSASTGVRAVLDVPRERPAEFISVELTGGTGGRFVRTSTIAVQSWAATRRRAAQIAVAVEAAAYGLMDEPGVFGVSVGDSYRWPDPDSGQQRYQTTIELTVCE